MIAAALLSGLLLAFRPPAPTAPLTLWTFAADRGFELDPAILGKFQQRTGAAVSVQVIGGRALDTRLLSLFMQRGAGARSPDVVEIEINSVGKFFRPTVDQIGFLPWDDYLDRHSLRSQFSPARLAVWTRDGHVFGLPQDLHPVTLTYRKDLFDAAGVDPTAASTWPQLQAACLHFERFWHARGLADRHAIELPAGSCDVLDIMLQQRHINLLDDRNNVCLTDPRIADSIVFYTGMIVGPGCVSADSNPSDIRWIRDLIDGNFCMCFTADWRASDIKQHAPGLLGKLAMMPLPRFDPDDAPTGSWGGTMMAVPRTCAHPELARALAIYLTTDPSALAANRLAGFDLIPPLPPRWSDPIYHQPDPFYFGNQSVDDLFVRLAAQLPTRHITPFTTIAGLELADVLRRGVAWRANHGESGLIEHCRQWLVDAAEDLRARIRFGTFQQ